MTLKEKFARKNATPASAAELALRSDAAENGISILAAEYETLSSNAALLDDEDEARLAEIATLLPIKQRALEAIRTAETEARQREALQTFEVDRAALDRATDKAARTFRTRYEKAAAEMVTVLEELRDSHDAWEAMARRGRELGIAVPSGAHLEKRVRGDQIKGVTARLLWPDTVIFGWNGVPIFGR